MFLVLFIVLSCSTKKDAFLNREYHAMVTEYNVMYNGELAFQRGLTEIAEKYEDNYWEILPIEPLTIYDEVLEVPDYSKNKKGKKKAKPVTPFDIAEAKAVKAVQKHSMNIGGKERNRKIDDAYLLLGKSRYYTSRFVPAMEAFNYVIKHYPEANLIDETLLWKAKTDVRLQNEETAIESLNALLEKEKLSDEIREDCYTTLAMAYSQMDSVVPLINSLQKAVIAGKDPNQKSRNLFILGQLYRQENHINRSQETFQELIDYRKAPYKYKVYAEIEKVKNHPQGNDATEVIERLNKLIRIRENRPYLDALYYQLAEIEKQRGNKEAAIAAYQMSVHTKQAKEFQKGLSYEGIGNIYFDDSDYANAGAYYDSVLQLSEKLNTKRIRRLRKKRQSLETVLVFEEIIVRNDSIWEVMAMDKDEQILYFNAYIETLKEKEKEAQEKEAFLKDLEAYEDAGLASVNIPSNAGSRGGKWYFYNTQTKGYGAQEFKQQWGKRKLDDNWRWSDKSVLKRDLEEVPQDSVAVAEETTVRPEHTVSYYLDQLPGTLEELDSISELRSSTYYQLGLIYKEQFKEYELAAEKLETLLVIFPEDKLVLGTNYHLYKIYSELGNPKAEYYSSVVVNRYPNSVFAKMILNPEEILRERKAGVSPESRYKEVYQLYDARKYIQAVYEISDALRIFEGDPLLPKFELLKAYCIAKIKGKEAFAKSLDYIVLNYANTAEGKRAKELLEMLK